MATRVSPPTSSQQTRYVDPMLFYCWSSVADAGPALKQHWINISCLWAVMHTMRWNKYRQTLQTVAWNQATYRQTKSSQSWYSACKALIVQSLEVQSQASVLAKTLYNNRINVIISRRNMVKSYLIYGKSISSNSQYRGTALRAISRFGESYCTGSLVLVS